MSSLLQSLLQPRRSRSVCILDLLADVELASCYHGLTLGERLILARTCQRMRHVAESKLAFQCSSIVLNSNDTHLALLDSAKSLKHAPLTIRLRAQAQKQWNALCSIKSWNRAVELDTTVVVRLNDEQWRRILQQDLSALQIISNRQMCSSSDVNAETIRRILALPKLHTLEMAPMYVRPADWTSLASAPHLTSIHLCDNPLSSLLPSIAQCTGLLHLRLTRPGLSGARFAEFFTSPNLRSLQSLSISDCVGFNALQPKPESVAPDFTAAFASLKNLQSLSLSRIDKIDALLAGLSACPSLTCLSIRPMDHPSSVPSLDSLVDLFASHRLVHVTLVSDLSVASLADLRSTQEKLGEFVWHRSRDPLHLFADRFSLTKSVTMLMPLRPVMPQEESVGSGAQ